MIKINKIYVIFFFCLFCNFIIKCNYNNFYNRDKEKKFKYILKIFILILFFKKLLLIEIKNMNYFINIQTI